MTTPYYVTDIILKKAFNVTLDSHHINHKHSKVTIKSNSENENNCVNKILKQLASIYVTLLNQINFENQTVFSARLNNQDEDHRAVDEVEFHNNLNLNKNLK